MREIALKNGFMLPQLSFGTWTFNDKSVVEPVKIALSCGYRLIDTASYYGNEKGIRKATVGQDRHSYMLAGKVWTKDRGYRKTVAAFEKSLKWLGTDYLDVYLIHWPATERRHPDWRRQNSETWQALCDLYQSGRVRAIGVCNFTPKYLEALDTDILPMINQIEYHPGFMQGDTVEYCRKKGIVLQAWSPFGRGEIFGNPVLREIAERNRCTEAQVCLRWVVSHGLNPVVKSSDRERIRENLEYEQVNLSPEDIRKIDEGPFWTKIGYDVEKVEF